MCYTTESAGALQRSLLEYLRSFSVLYTSTRALLCFRGMDDAKKAKLHICMVYFLFTMHVILNNENNA